MNVQPTRLRLQSPAAFCDGPGPDKIHPFNIFFITLDYDFGV